MTDRSDLTIATGGHTIAAQRVAATTGWDLDAYAEEHGWEGVGIGPVGRHRDSDILAQSNFDVVYADLHDTFGDSVDIARFVHFAVGWVEEIAWDSTVAGCARLVDAWAESLEDYPAASDEDLSEREYADALETLTQCYDVPEDRAGDVFIWLFDAYSHCRGEDYRSDDVTEALTALGIDLDA